MSENKRKFDLLLLNNASREFFLFSGLLDSSETHLYHRFTDLDLGDLKDGEYTYCLLRNERDDVEYDFKTPLGDTIVHADGQEILLRDLQAPTGLLRVGSEIKPTNTYDNNKEKTIFYYDN